MHLPFVDGQVDVVIRREITKSFHDAFHPDGFNAHIRITVFFHRIYLSARLIQQFLLRYSPIALLIYSCNPFSGDSFPLQTFHAHPSAGK